MALIDARPNNNYWHFIDVWETGAYDSNNRTRELGIRYWIDVRVSGSYGSWSGGETRRFGAWVDGQDHPRDLSFDTRNGADFTVLDIRQWVYAGDGRTIEVHGYFQGWSSSFPGYQDNGGRFNVSRVEPATPVVSPPSPPTLRNPINITPIAFGVQYDRGADNGGPILQDQFHWRRLDTGELVWDDPFPTGYTSPAAGAGPELQPMTSYRIGGRSRNSAGWGPWSAEVIGTTLPGARVFSGSAWRWAIPFVKYEGAWRQAAPFNRASGVWASSG